MIPIWRRISQWIYVFFLLFNIIKSQCIRDCSGHGRCIGFECHCAVGFDGEDCSVALTAMMDHEYVYPLLSVGDFNLTMQKYHKLLQNSHKKPFVIGFSSSGCQKCLQYEKEYMEIIPYLKSKKLKLTRVDLYHEKNLCRLLQINHVPSFMVIKDRKPRLFAGQEHTKDNLLAYIQKQLDPPVQLLNSIDQVHNFLGLHRRNQIHIVAFFQDAHDLEEDELLEYSEAAKTLQHQHNMYFGIVKDSQVTQGFFEPQGNREWYIQDTPTLVLITHETVEKPLHLNLKEAMHNVHQEIAIYQWILQHSVLLVDELKPSNFEIYASLGLPMLILFLDMDEKNQDILKDFEQAAKEYKGEITFVYADGIRYSDRMSSLGLGVQSQKNLPAMAFNTKENRQMPFPKEFDIHLESIRVFCHEFMTSRLTFQAQSQLIQTLDATTKTKKKKIKNTKKKKSQDEIRQSHKGIAEVFDATSENYLTQIISIEQLEELVLLDFTKDTVLLLHSPITCNACLHFAPYIKKVALRFYELQISSLQFIHVNVDELVPPSWLRTNAKLPSLLLIPANDKNPPFRFFSGSGQVLPIMKWIQQHVSNQFELPPLAQFNEQDRELYKQQVKERHEHDRKQPQLKEDL